MKKILSLMLAVCMLLTLVACTTEQPQETIPTTKPTTAPTDPSTAPTDPSTAPTQPTTAPTTPPATDPSTPPATQPTTPVTPPSGEQPALSFPEVSPDEVQIGTPAIDGVVDAAYLSSLRMSVDYTNVFKVPVSSSDEIKADVFFLHDGTYLYMVANVTGDSTVVNTGLASWAADSVEVWFSSPTQSSKLVMDAFGTPVGDSGFPGDATNRNEDKLKIYQKGVEIAAIQYDTGYVVEAKIQIPYYKKSEGSIAVNLQLNNMYSADAHNDTFEFSIGGCYGSQPGVNGAEPNVIYLALA